MSTPTTQLEQSLEVANRRAVQLEGILDKCVSLEGENAELRELVQTVNGLLRDCQESILQLSYRDQFLEVQYKLAFQYAHHCKDLYLEAELGWVKEKQRADALEAELFAARELIETRTENRNRARHLQQLTQDNQVRWMEKHGEVERELLAARESNRVLEAEAVRLREALEQISRDRSAYSLAEIARKALKAGERHG